jgi:hypothetical protein
MTTMLNFSDGELRVSVDPGRGADILSLVHRPSGVDVLFSTPWREHADAIRAGMRTPTTYDPVAGWLEQYRGGWQLLCPIGGPPRTVAGAPVGFHGEAASAHWQVVADDDAGCDLSTTLFSVPVRIDRSMRLLGGGTLALEDRLTNLSDVELEVDYISHPAFGGSLLDGRVTLDTGARRYTADPGTTGSFVEPGSEHKWPYADGVDLRELPTPGVRRMAFGWLSEFDSHWASVTNHDLGVTARLDWDGTHLPYAWFWQELNWTEGFPWHRRARVIAVEPSSTPTSGPERVSVLRLPPRGDVSITHSISVTTTPTGAA